MSVVETRGGFPHVFKDTVDNTTGRMHRIPFITKYLQIKVATNPCKVYFTETDFTNDQNYVTVAVASATEPHGFEGPAEINQIWLLGSGGNSVVELVAYQRRG